MATAASIAFSRTPAPFERVRLFLGGTRWWIVVLVFVWLAWPMFVMSHDIVFILFATALVAPALAITAALLDRKVADRLAFAALLPRAASPKWLLLVPLHTAAVLVVATAAVTAGRSPVVAVTAAGCCMWAVAIGRWLGRRWWTLAAIPALALAPFSILWNVRIGSWGMAAATSVGLPNRALIHHKARTQRSSVRHLFAGCGNKQ